MTSYEDTKVQLTINRMTEECYDNIPDKSSTELYLVSQDPTTPAKIDLDAQSKTDADISAIQQEISNLSTEVSSVEAEVSTLSDWTAQQIDGLIDDIQEVSSNLTHSIVRRWEYVEYDGLTFTAGQANSTISMQKVGDAPNVSLEYSTGNGWSDFEVGTTTITLPNIGDQVVVRAKTTNTTFATDLSSYNQFVMTGEVLASDSIMYLLKSDADLSAIPADYCFCHLFRDCSALTEAPELPAMTLDDSCYRGMFRNTSLTEAPALPATTLADNCYAYMFHSCSDLAQIMDELPVETLADSCYEGMFYHCTSLATPPDLPSTTLAFSCYCHMFDGCTSLASAPELPATTLARACYNWMFLDCTSLTDAPELPATTLAFDCYHGMFMRCTSLENPPSELPATTMAEYCYVLMFNQCPMETAPAIKAETLATECFKSMFWDCTQLNEIRIAYTGNFSGQDVPTDAFANWVNNVSSTGTFYYDGEDTTTGINAIPTGWDVRRIHSSDLTIEARTANVTIGSSRQGSPSARNLEYSVDGGTTWNPFTLGSTTVTLANIGDKMMLRGTNSTIANTWQNYWKLTFSDDVDVYGNLNSLLGGSEETLTGSFYGLFDGQTHLIDASDLVLPWTTLDTSALGCPAFEAMFRNCTSLTAAPELPATTLPDFTYKDTFSNCTSLIEAPDLPATTLGISSYEGMFKNCSSLTTAPTIYAVELGQTSLMYTFDGCSSLTGEVSFPNLQTANARSAMERCFRGAGMEIVSMPNLTSAQARNAMTGIFEGCPNLTTINVPKLSYTSGSYNMNAFAVGASSLEVVDWSQATQVPAIQQSATQMFSSADYKIVVPDNLYATWTTAGYWSSIASHIVKASEYNNNN